MRKPKLYLLIAGTNYYPERSTGDWIECFRSEKEAMDKVTKVKSQYQINNEIYDWYDIVDLKEWLGIEECLLCHGEGIPIMGNERCQECAGTGIG